MTLKLTILLKLTSLLKLKLSQEHKQLSQPAFSWWMASKDLLYEKSKGFGKEFTILHMVLELMKLRAIHGWPDASFNELLEQTFKAKLVAKMHLIWDSYYIRKSFDATSFVWPCLMMKAVKWDKCGRMDHILGSWIHVGIGAKDLRVQEGSWFDIPHGEQIIPLLLNLHTFTYSSPCLYY